MSPSLLSQLIPVPHFRSGFTTSQSITHKDLQLIPFEDHALGVNKVSPRTPHKIVTPPAASGPVVSPPEHAWEAFYPKGSINPAGKSPGGFSFYLSGPAVFKEQLGEATEAVMSYRMMLQEGWEWRKGGKLPGIFGGVGDSSYSCTGGTQHERCECFNLRPMWRSESVAELYAYLPLTDENESVLLAVPPASKSNGNYGISVGQDSFRFDVAVGQWVSMAFRVKLNTTGKYDGEIQLWVDGRSVINVGGVSLCDSADIGRIKGMHFQTFFGGHTEEWASPRDQRAWFADVTGVIIN
ncbi:polysaccharide lyase family 14 protein [Infundibulicybe gibba]|nr:polysaccharide lyase family 14 protein [Infundibulicybe gibba]